MANEKYTMIGVEVSRYEEAWVIYPTGGSYFKDEFLRLPAGSMAKEEKANEVLDALNLAARTQVDPAQITPVELDGLRDSA